MRLLLCVLLSLPLYASSWIGWEVPTRSSVCHDGCRCTSSGRLLIALQMAGERVQRVRFFDPACEPGLDGLTVERREMTPVTSIDFLAKHLPSSTDAESLVTAIALHDHEHALPVLIDLARHDKDGRVRRHAIFWLGQRAGEKMAGELRRAVDDDPDEDVKTHAVFAIAQLPPDRSVPMLIDLAKSHRSAVVRKRAMFWLAQADDPRALDFIESVLQN